MNRIIQAIERTTKQIDSAGVDSVKLGILDRKLDIDVTEYATFQDAKSQAQASGRITFDEAVTIYAYLGAGPVHFNNQTVAVKVTLTKLFAELLASRLGAGRPSLQPTLDQ